MVVASQGRGSPIWGTVADEGPGWLRQEFKKAKRRLPKLPASPEAADPSDGTRLRAALSGFCPENLAESFNESVGPLCSGERWNSVNDEERHAI